MIMSYIFTWLCWVCGLSIQIGINIGKWIKTEKLSSSVDTHTDGNRTKQMNHGDFKSTFFADLSWLQSELFSPSLNIAEPISILWEEKVVTVVRVLVLQKQEASVCLEVLVCGLWADAMWML